MASNEQREISQPFRPRARLLQLLGDELIGSSRLAIFELVKNAYDADATRVDVELDLSSNPEPVIRITDDGGGMSLDVLRDVWLVPGNDHRHKQRDEGMRSKKFHRLPLGEKGLGRFAVHKLGNVIHLVTREAGSDECVVEINWAELIRKPFLDQAPVKITVREPQVFKGKKTGTQITISELRQPQWSRGEIRRLHRQITSICSPFESPDGFFATLTVPGQEELVEDLLDVDEILNRAIWKFKFRLENGKFDWTYEFRKIPGLRLEKRSIKKRKDSLKLPPPLDSNEKNSKVVADAATTKGIGAITGEFYVYDRDREVLKRLSDIQLLGDYLDENGGIRVYRDGIRVYNYGEPGDDWLGLDLRRVNAPTRGISRNIVIGAIHLSLEESGDLVEKTNREGFVENAACARLKRIVLGALATLESERQIDKDRIRSLTKSKDPETDRIKKPIERLRKALRKEGIQKKFEPYLVKIEHDYHEMQHTLLSAGLAGLNLAVIFHEVEHGVKALHQIITEGPNRESAAQQAKELMQLLDGFAALLRKDSKEKHSAKKLLLAARQYNVLRFRHHKVRLVCPLLESDSAGFESKYAFGLVMGALNNLIDNSIYWMRVRYPDTPEKQTGSPRKLYLNISDEFDAGPAIVIADTGTGFQGDDADRLTRPFFTRRPEGMGLGLYYANLAMELNGGQLVFPKPGEVEVPREFDGAVIALVFKEVK